MIDEYLLTTAELAGKMRVSTETIRRMRRAKKIPFIPLGRQFRYRWSDVIKTIEPGVVSNAH